MSSTTSLHNQTSRRGCRAPLRATFRQRRYVGRLPACLFVVSSAKWQMHTSKQTIPGVWLVTRSDGIQAPPGTPRPARVVCFEKRCAGVPRGWANERERHADDLLLVGRPGGHRDRRRYLLADARTLTRRGFVRSERPACSGGPFARSSVAACVMTGSTELCVPARVCLPTHASRRTPWVAVCCCG